MFFIVILGVCIVVGNFKNNIVGYEYCIFWEFFVRLKMFLKYWVLGYINLFFLKKEKESDFKSISYCEMDD